jgi:protein-disulfide isomerase
MRDSAFLALGVVLAVLGASCHAPSAGPTPGGGAAGPLGAQPDDLTPAERRTWTALLEELAAPCPGPRVSIAQCTEQRMACPACVPAAKFLRKGVRDGRARGQIHAAYKLRFDPGLVKAIDLGDAPSLGPASAPVTIVEFADFQCPFCASTVGLLDRVVTDLAPHVRVVFKNFPLPSHEHGELAARAAVAAQNQGRFWPMHHKLFENQRALGPQVLEQLARDLGLDVGKFQAELAAPETVARVKRSRADGARANVSGTPAIFVNGRPVDLKHFDVAGGDLTEWVALELEILGVQRADARPPGAAAPAGSAPASIAR